MLISDRYMDGYMPSNIVRSHPLLGVRAISTCFWQRQVCLLHLYDKVTVYASLLTSYYDNYLLGPIYILGIVFI